MIVVFGSINADLVARVDRFPQPGETVAGTSFATLPGGKGANQALAARRAGARVAMAGAIGDDGFAAIALANLVAAGVELDGVRRVAGTTGIASILVDANGQNAIAVVAGANSAVSADDLPSALLGPDTTLLLQLEVPIDAVSKAAVQARASGARVVLNAAPAQPLPDELVAALDVLIVNEHEAAVVARDFHLPTTPRDFAAALHLRRGCAVVVTLGESGALAAAQRMLWSTPAPNTRVVDSTGAGDAFAGALAAALDRGASWPRALVEGVAAGSIACTARGAQDALPSAADIAALATAVESKLLSRPVE